MGVVEIACVFLGEFLLGDSTVKKMSDYQKKYFFINKSI